MSNNYWSNKTLLESSRVDVVCDHPYPAWRVDVVCDHPYPAWRVDAVCDHPYPAWRVSCLEGGCCMWSSLPCLEVGVVYDHPYPAWRVDAVCDHPYPVWRGVLYVNILALLGGGCCMWSYPYPAWRVDVAKTPSPPFTILISTASCIRRVVQLYFAEERFSLYIYFTKTTQSYFTQ